MTKSFLLSATLVFTALLPLQANASTFDFSFAGSGVSGSIDLTYGTTADSKYPQALAVTGISGTFYDSNNGLNIVDASIISLVPLHLATPESSNKLAPADFSKFAVASGLSQDGNAITYTNLFYPGGSPQTASSYPFSGGFLDIYGLLFNIGGGRVVNFWSNGDDIAPGVIDYGAAVATADKALDYEAGNVNITPEPSAFGLIGMGLTSLLLLRRRVSRN